MSARKLKKACVTVLVVALTFLPINNAQTLQIGVLGASPENGLLLAAAVNAGLRRLKIDAGNASLAAVEPLEPLDMPAHICLQASEGVLVSVGPVGGAEAATRAGLALLLTEPAPTDRGLSSALELYPHFDVLAKACADLCEDKGWTKAVLLYEGSANAAPLLAPDHEVFALHARQLPAPHDEDTLRNLLLVLKKWGATNFIVWCSAECSVRVLDAAQRVGLLGERHSYVLPALDLHTWPLDSYSHGGANITSLRIFDPDSEKVREAMDAWRKEYTILVRDADVEDKILQIVENPPTDILLSYEAARIVAEGAEYLNLQQGMPAGSCEHGRAAFHAETVLNYVRSMEWKGVSGPMSWEAGGSRRAVQLHVAELQRGGQMSAAAAWTPRDGLAWHARPRARPPPRALMTNRTFTVLIAENKPYVMRQQSSDRLSGNARYEGFCIELIDRLAKQLNFNYTFREQLSGGYGTLNKTTGQWTGMMHRLMTDEDIDFAITDLTITAEREGAVDFTTPFMNLGISILFRKPQPPEPELLAFLLPFSKGVWLCLGLAYLGTSLVLYMVGRLCPDEWQNPYPCIDEPPALENQFTLANALWFNLGAVLQQGSEIAPVAYGSRAVASVWWLFALVITSSYTANLATLLASKTSDEIIHNVRDLADNEQGITYGAKAGGSTYTFFEFSTDELYKRMYKKMKEQEMPTSNDEGIEKVMTENYAFFAESTTIEYTTERNCEVTRVGDLLDSKGFGIAMKKGSVYRQAMNLALLNLQEAGVLREMTHRWWKEMHGGGACQPTDDFETERLSMDNFMGLFLVLVVGCALGVVVSCCDLTWTAWRHPRNPSRSFTASFWSELRFVFDFERSEKPVRGALTPAPNESDSPAVTLTTPSLSPPDEPEVDEGRAGSARRASSRSRHSASRRSSMHVARARLARHAVPPSQSRMSSPTPL